MKRYLVFAGECYYARGGMSDFVGFHDDLKEAQKKPVVLNDRGCEEDIQWWHVFDTHEEKIVFQYGRAHFGLIMTKQYDSDYLVGDLEVELPYGLRPSV